MELNAKGEEFVMISVGKNTRLLLKKLLLDSTSRNYDDLINELIDDGLKLNGLSRLDYE